MREAIGGTWIFQIVIFFILLFTGYMCLSINHSKAFNVKNEIVKELERANHTYIPDSEDQAMKNIVSYLKDNSYRTTGKCPDDYKGYNRDGKLDSQNSAFCIKQQSVASDSTMPAMVYFRVIVFYQLDLPIFKSVFQFRVSGDTKIISRSWDVA